MEFKDYYSALNVTPEAGADEVKRSWRKLARKYHPDVSKEHDAVERMKEINEAYEVLSNPERRAAYDKLRRGGYRAGQEFKPPPDWDAGFEFSGGPGFGGAGMDAGHAADFSEFFESLFRGPGRRGDGSRAGARDSSRGDDHHAKIFIDLEDSFNGARRRIGLHAPELDSAGNVRMRERVLEVSIPKGVREGQMIRLSGQGNPGLGGGPPGDLYLEVRFNPHRLYRADGRDLHLDLPVAPWEAALGGTVRVPTPAGAVEMDIPPDSPNGRKLRIRGRGLPGEPPGDIYVLLDVVLPPAATDRAREIYRTMARELAFDPRKNLEA